MDPSAITLLSYSSNAIAAIAFLALPFLIVNWVKYMRSLPSSVVTSVARWANFPTKSVLFFIVPIMVSMTISGFITSVVRSQVLAFLNSLPIKHEVFVNGKPAQNPDVVLATLRTIAPLMAHHSHPTSTVRIEVQTNGKAVILNLGRDSGISQEYWVFYPGYPVTALNEIGRITTPVFDDY